MYPATLSNFLRIIAMGLLLSLCSCLCFMLPGGGITRFFFHFLLSSKKSSFSQDPLITPDTVVSGADGDGLRASWRTLHVYPDDYPTHRGYLALRCRATIATRPPHVRSMSVRLYVAARPHISSYMFSKNSKYCIVS